MQTYWDFTEQERAAMTREDVQKWLDAELMTKGVLKVIAPKLEEVPKVSTPPTVTKYRLKYKDPNYSYSERLTEYAFDTIEDANICCKMHLKYVHDRNGKKYLIPIEEISVVPVECLTHSDYLKIRGELDSADQIKRRNDSLTSEYNKASAKMDEVLNGVWDDWGSCRADRDEHQKVLDTFSEYTRISGGDESVAAKFLQKAYSLDQIKNAYKWFGIQFPFDETSTDTGA